MSGIAPFGPAPHGARAQAGVTLVELVLAIVVLAVAAGAISLLFTQNLAHSADPLVEMQEIAVARSYLAEILAKPIHDPLGSTAPPASRAAYDDVLDYDGLSEPPTDQNGTPLGLNGYQVTVHVDATGARLGNLRAPQVVRVDVTVRGPGDTSVRLSGYRSDF